MLPPPGQNGSDYQHPAGPALIGVLGWMLFGTRVFLLLLLLASVLPLLLITRLFTRRRIWPQIYFRGVCRIIGLRTRVHGRPQHNALYLPNHISWMDIPALLGTTGSAFVANDSLAGSRLFKVLADMNDTVFIARHRRTTIGAQVEDVRRALSDAGALTIFIEGTTSDGAGVLPFKSALLSALEPLPDDVTVQPVFLHYADGRAVAWVGDEPGLDNVKRMLSRWRAIRLDLYFCDPLDGESLQNRKMMAAAAQQAVVTRMGAPSSPLHE
ncbi:putative acyltransferase [Caenibius tardaugens NBRC 16725]|uniref:Putative acyltransferase n=1 Tax=Caenibius tardaugens NBRC 16725 TaxID=1219035 RepID=U2YIT5_9SPHN|nr:lysophospholipid acyltransferase family protein [Caenibius tardaugens]AZI34552.1 1-acyl-sn-glycerol-3-phosphate acyltransferase [Caenibius tardaugens NBRC 16725]GAD48052.1 putative acyltransferase [Caenibius tardaugens NBRC 16725]